MYKVLWIDDQYKDPEMVQFAIDAENNGLLLDGYRSFEEGFNALEIDLRRYDVILLDGLFFERKSQELGTEDEAGIGMAIAKINELKRDKVFPWFVLSGKDKFTKGENVLLKANKAKCFDKTNPTDVVNLFEQMVLAASKEPQAQLKHKYNSLLDVCSDRYLGSTQFSRLFSLIEYIESEERVTNTADMLIPIRKIMEKIFTCLGELEIIPEAIISNKGWINGSSLFLSRKHDDYEYTGEIVPPIVCENIHRILNITQDASHGEGNLKLRVDQYLKNAKSDFLYRSCIYLLFDILIWFVEFVDSHEDKERNRSLWKCIRVWSSGTVARVAYNGWGTMQIEDSHLTLSIPPDMMSENALNELDRIRVITAPGPNGKTHIKAISKE